MLKELIKYTQKHDMIILTNMKENRNEKGEKKMKEYNRNQCKRRTR